MTDCANPHCLTDLDPVDWLDTDYCSRACRHNSRPLCAARVDSTCFRPGCTQPAGGNGYCSDRCRACDTPPPVDAGVRDVRRVAWSPVPAGHEPTGDREDEEPLVLEEPLPPSPWAAAATGGATSGMAVDEAGAGATGPLSRTPFDSEGWNVTLTEVPLAHVNIASSSDVTAGVVVYFAEIGGTHVHNVHPPDRCAGRPCVIHNPSDHHMRDWPKVWRNDLRMVERTCEHGIGHPDPDDLAHRLTQPGQVGERDSGVHGCDGCCVDPELAHLGPMLDRAVAAIFDPDTSTSECLTCGTTFPVLGVRVDQCGACYLRERRAADETPPRRRWWHQLLRRNT
jgi:hypothetical protein